MSEKQDLKSRLVTGMKRDGRREYDEDALDELVELCLKSRVSIARMATRHDVNPNQLRKWIARYQQRQVRDLTVDDAVSIDMAPTLTRAIEPVQPAFVPVATSAPGLPAESAPHAEPITALRSVPSMTLALHVRLSNGVELELGKAIASIDELTTLVQILGRLPCSGSTTG
jgi:transposase